MTFFPIQRIWRFFQVDALCTSYELGVDVTFDYVPGETAEEEKRTRDKKRQIPIALLGATVGKEGGKDDIKIMNRLFWLFTLWHSNIITVLQTTISG